MIKQYFETIAQYNKELKNLHKKLKQEHRKFFVRSELSYEALDWGYKNYLVYPVLKDTKGNRWFLSACFDIDR